MVPAYTELSCFYSCCSLLSALPQIFTSESPTSVLSPVKKEPSRLEISPAVDAAAGPATAATATASLAAASKKLCRKCGRHKALEDFYKSKASADGRDGRCKACDAVHCRRRREKIPRVEVSHLNSGTSVAGLQGAELSRTIGKNEWIILHAWQYHLLAAVVQESLMQCCTALGSV